MPNRSISEALVPRTSTAMHSQHGYVRNTDTCNTLEEIILMSLKLPTHNRFSYRCPRNRKTREMLKVMSLPIVIELAGQHLELPLGEDLESLTARYWEIGVAVMGDPNTIEPSHRERVQAFVKEFLHLACAPRAGEGCAEPGDSESGPGDVPVQEAA
jgi:hypothetical protein